MTESNFGKCLEPLKDLTSFAGSKHLGNNRDFLGLKLMSAVIRP